jgi:hypothetical protein
MGAPHERHARRGWLLMPQPMHSPPARAPDRETTTLRRTLVTRNSIDVPPPKNLPVKLETTNKGLAVLLADALLKKPWD